MGYCLQAMRKHIVAIGAAVALSAGAAYGGAGPLSPAADPPAEGESAERSLTEFTRHHDTGNDSDSGAELIGRPAPPWSFDRWIGVEPLTVEKLRGKVVLVRWWTEGCRYCAATLPVVEEIRRKHHQDELVVIAAFHPKPPRRVRDRYVVSAARELGFTGSIAVDARWSTLERYWLGGRNRSFTSVTFLIDRGGIIRWVHGGGEFHPTEDPGHARCDLDYRGLEAALAAALEDRGEPGSADP